MPYDHLASIPKGKTAQATLEVGHLRCLPLRPCLKPCTAMRCIQCGPELASLFTVSLRGPLRRMIECAVDE